MDGLQLLTQGQDHLDGVARVLLTAHASIELARDALNDGRIDRFLIKPVRTSELLDEIGPLLRAARAEQARQAAFHRAIELLRSGPHSAHVPSRTHRP